MPECFIGEVRLFPYTDAPEGWHTCDGSLLPIALNQALFSLLGTRFGGNGSTTFAVPDLRGRAALHKGQSAMESGQPIPTRYAIGDKGGAASVPLSAAQALPGHTHSFMAADAPASVVPPTGNFLATVTDTKGGNLNIYADPGGPPRLSTFAGDSTGETGGAAHQNMQPSLGLNYCIATHGIYPNSVPYQFRRQLLQSMSETLSGTDLRGQSRRHL